MKLFALLFVVMLALGSPSFAAEVHVTVERAPTATAQLEVAQRYALEAMRARTVPEREVAMANASANFQATRFRASKNRNLYINAALLEADMFLAVDFAGNAVTLLGDITNKYPNGPGAASAQLRLGRALLRLHDNKKAEDALLAAEKDAHVDGATVEFAVAKELGDLYTKGGRYKEAVPRYRRLYRELADDPSHRAFFAIQSARAAVAGGDVSGARADLNAADEFVRKAQMSTSDAASGRLQLQLADDIKKMRDTHKIH
jgi:tetratricopeptide (TPR) repeat protein